MLPEQCTLRVLVVDDNADAAQVLTLLVGLWGYEARAAMDGFEALSEANEFRPDVVLCDLAMPGLDGCTVAHSLRRLAAHNGTLLVAVTAHGDEENRRKAACSGFQAHFVKPVEADDLHRLLEARAAELHNSGGWRRENRN
jgi:two-component system, OmpR family, response regulator